jgi:hypothetical protein
LCEEGGQDRDGTQEVVDDVVDKLSSCLHDTFSKFGLARKRTFKNQGRKPESASYGAPEELRELRRAESRARSAYVTSLRASATPETLLLLLKYRWNFTVGKCRKLAKAVRAGFCSDWRALWDKLRNEKKRQLWNTLRQFTSQQPIEIACSQEDQFKHWSSQGDVEEAVWSVSEKENSERLVEWHRNEPYDSFAGDPVTPEEAATSLKRLHNGRAPGEDGIPAEVLTNLGSLLEVAVPLFTILLKACTYPSRWGPALIRALLKPGKPANLASSLRGIRLLNSWAAWFG